MTHPPITVYVPQGIPAAIERAAKAESLCSQVMAYVFVQLWFRLSADILDQEDTPPRDVTVPMNAVRLRSIYKGADKHLLALERQGIVWCRAPHLAGITSRPYSIGAAIDPTSEQEPYILDKPTVLNSWHRVRKSRQPKDPYFQRRQAMLQEFDFDTRKAGAWIRSNWREQKYPHLWLHSAVRTAEAVAGKRTLTTDTFSGREHSPVTRLHRELRRTCLTYRGQLLAEHDVPAAQPAFLLVHLLRNKPSYVEQEDLDEMQEALAADLYLYLASQHETAFGSKPSRDAMKKAVLYFLFGNRVQSNLAKVFDACFPTVCRFVENQKSRYGNESVAKLLQGMESTWMKKLSQGLIEQDLTPHFTVHDSFSCASSLKGSVGLNFYDSLDGLGMQWVRGGRVGEGGDS